VIINIVINKVINNKEVLNINKIIVLLDLKEDIILIAFNNVISLILFY